MERSAFVWMAFHLSTAARGAHEGLHLELMRRIAPICFPKESEWKYRKEPRMCQIPASKYDHSVEASQWISFGTWHMGHLHPS